MLRLFKQGGTLGILIDQDIREVQSVFVPFFGRPAATPRAAADLALRFGATVLVVTCHRRGARPGDGHRVEVVEVPYDAAPADREAEVIRLTAACVAAPGGGDPPSPRRVGLDAPAVEDRASAGL